MKKVGGLSKKIPAIFEGIPDIEPAPQPKGKKPRGAWSRVLSPEDLRFLFEIGESSIKVMVLKKLKNQWKILESKRRPFEADSQGSIEQELQVLRETLSDCLNEFPGMPKSETRVLFSKKGTYTAEMEKPATPGKESENELRWQIADKLAFSAEEAKLIFEPRNGHLLAVAVEARVIESVLSYFHEAGITPRIVTLLPLAYEGLAQNYPPLSSSTTLLLDMGKDRTSVLIFQKGQFRLFREVGLGGDQITQAMTGSFMIGDKPVGIAPQEAETLKLNLGLPTPDLTIDPDDPKRSQLAAAVRPVFEKLVSELRNSIFQYERQFQGQKIETIFLAGGGGQLKGLEIYLSKQFNLPVQILKLETLGFDPNPSFTALAGLGFLKETRINFASMEDLLRRPFETYLKYVRIASFTVAGILLLVLPWTSMRIFVSSNELKKVEKKSSGIASISQRMEELETTEKEIGTFQSIITQEIEWEPYLGAVFREISRLTPSSMQLKKISYQKHPDAIMEFSGTIRPSPLSPDLVLSDFLEAINHSPFFADSTLKSRSAAGGDDQTMQFLIQTKLVSFAS